MPGTQDQLDTIISKWKDFANAFSLKAEVCLIQKDTTEAAKMLDKSLTYDPYNVGAWRTRGLISMNRHQWKDADNFLTKAIHFEPKAVDDYLNRALARLNYNNLRGALSDYDLAIEYDPNNFLAHYNRGLLTCKLGR
jgi:tetratricopeptide (TPR) repeat protein